MEKSLTFRQASAADLPALVALLADDTLGATREDATLPLNEGYVKAFEQIAQDDNNQLWLICLDGAVAGCLQLTFIPNLTYKGSWRALIEGVRVDSQYRGQGLGEKLFKHAIERAKDKGCMLVQLTSDKKRPDAIRFYEQLGFVASHEGMKLAL